MRTSLSMRAAAAVVAALPLLWPGLEAGSAHGQASFGAAGMRPGFVHNRGFAPGFRDPSRQSWNWRGRYGWNRYSRNGRFSNGGGFYGGFYGPGFWYSPYGYGDAGYTYGDAGGLGGGSLIIGVGAPYASNFPAAAADSPDPNLEGGCVIHKLIYDRSGKFVGDRQTAGC